MPVDAPRERLYQLFTGTEQDVVADHREQFPNADIETAIRPNRQFCAGPEFEEVVPELIENALKHAGKTPIVSITVADDGPGIDEMWRRT